MIFTYKKKPNHKKVGSQSRKNPARIREIRVCAGFVSRLIPSVRASADCQYVRTHRKIVG